ncbi:hypothetical protein ACFLTX_00795 [Chloroflexota bacterium]
MSLEKKITNKTTDLFDSIESRLSGILKPVEPNPDFVNTLRDRVRSVQHPSIIKKFNNLQFITIVIAGVLSLVVLVTMIARLILNLLSPERKSTGFS